MQLEKGIFSFEVYFIASQRCSPRFNYFRCCQRFYGWEREKIKVPMFSITVLVKPSVNSFKPLSWPARGKKKISLKGNFYNKFMPVTYTAVCCIPGSPLFQQQTFFSRVIWLPPPSPCLGLSRTPEVSSGDGRRESRSLVTKDRIRPKLGWNSWI